MHESEGLCMQGLSRQQPEAILDELAVFGVDCPFADFSPVISPVVEKRMAYPVEMYADLMSPACFEAAFHDSHIAESFKHFVMSHGMLPVVSVRKYLEAHPVGRVAADVAGDCPLVIREIAPDNRDLASVYRVHDKLFREVKLGFFSLGHYQQP